VLPKTNYEVVTPDYFKTVGTPLLEGRDFDDRDSEQAEPAVIISRTLAQRIRSAGHSPLGYRLRLGLDGPGWRKVVGVCSDARYRTITQTGADIFVPYLQALQPTNYVVIRGTRSAEDLAALVRRTLAGIDSNQAVAGVATIGDLIDANAARHQFNMILLLWFGVCAAILAATGVYSVIAETMTARQHEIAIRTALGAQRTRLVRDMISGALAFVLAGEWLGALIVAAAAKLGSELLFGVSARDPFVLGSVAAFVFLVSLGACFWPAWFAASRDPKASLRAS
jgi:putative ABC transport system permease protein